MRLSTKLLTSALLAQLANCQAVYFYSGDAPDGGDWPSGTGGCMAQLIDIYGCSSDVASPIGITENNYCLNGMLPAANLHKLSRL